MSDTRSGVATARSLLFAPGSEPRKLSKALASIADLVIADLEDAVTPDQKPAARNAVAAAAAEPGAHRLVIRVNAADTKWFADDLALAIDLRRPIVLPKASSQALAAVATVQLPVIALTETAQGILDIAEVAARSPVVRLMLGGVDLAGEMRLGKSVQEMELLVPRFQMAAASAAAGLPAPIDTPYTDLPDLGGLSNAARAACALGFGGKACVHPRQVGVINRAFSPSPDELAWARRVTEAFEGAGASGRGAIQVGGEMIDRPVFERARQLLAHERASARAALPG